MRFSRRTFLFGGLAASGITLGSSQAFTTWDLQTRHHTFSIPELDPAFNQYRIGYLSDIHLGVFITEDWMEYAVSLLVNAAVDIIIIGGDHINVPAQQTKSNNDKRVQLSTKERQLAAQILKRFVHILDPTSVPDGILAVPGNHDNWNAAPLVKTYFETAGIRYLVNETELITRGNAELEFTGVDDFWTGIPQLPAARRKQKSPASILISHNPDYLSLVLQQTEHPISLGLAGHTHGGQICLPGQTPIITGIQDSRLVAGVCTALRAPVLTSTGVGVVEIPCRIHCPPEVHIITLQTV